MPRRHCATEYKSRHLTPRNFATETSAGAVFVGISHKDVVNGLIRKTHQMAYVSPKVEDLVCSRQAMESLKLVANLDG